VGVRDFIGVGLAPTPTPDSEKYPLSGVGEDKMDAAIWAVVSKDMGVALTTCKMASALDAVWSGASLPWANTGVALLKNKEQMTRM
jgi:hypothetical protein